MSVGFGVIGGLGGVYFFSFFKGFVSIFFVWMVFIK